MALESNLICTGQRLAGADLSNAQFCFVKLNSAGAVVLAGAGEAAYGVLQNKPADGQVCTIAIFGETKVKCGGIITGGGIVASGASGVAVAATGARVNTSDAGAAADALVGPYVMGTVLATTASGDIATMLLRPMGAVPTTVAA